MSLQVWLPLTKDLRNQGLSNITATNNGATYSSTGGKLGGCYNFTSQNIVVPSTNFKSNFTNNQASLAAWVKVSTSHSAYAQAMVLGTQGTSWNNILFGIDINGSGFPIANASTGSAYTNLSFGTAIKDGVWHHIVYTYNAGTMTVYLDGIQKNTTTTSNTPAWTSTTNLYIGGNSGGEKFQNGDSMNDVRLYNHCLSPMEVKELAKGLVLHYPLNGHNETLVPFGYQQLEYIESSGSSYFNTGYKFNPEVDACKVEFKGNDVSNTGMIFADSGGKYFWLYYYGTSGIRVYADNGTGQQGINGISSDLNKHIAEYKNKHYYIDGVDKGSLSKTYTEDTNTIWLFSYGGSGYPFKGRIYYTDIKRNDKIQKIYIPAKRISDSAVGMYELVNNEFFVSASTAFVAGPVLKIPSVVYDCSGFCNNGETTGTLYTSSDTAKYAVSTHFNGSSAIKDSTFSFSSAQWSVAFWYKFTAAPSAYQGFICLSRNAGADADKKFAAMPNSSYIWLKFESINYSLQSLKTNQWCHIVMTCDGTNGQVYENGILKYTTGSVGTILTDCDDFVVGARANSANAATTSVYLNGNMSDVRIYATALSVDDVKSLYQNSAYIDSSGNVYGAVHTEV